jgi:hypothetical protein
MFNSGRTPMAFLANSGVIKYGPCRVSRQTCLVTSSSPPVRTNDNAPLKAPIETAITFNGTNHMLPAVTPVITPAFSMLSSAQSGPAAALLQRHHAAAIVAI